MTAPRTLALLLVLTVLGACGVTPYAVRAPGSTCTARCANLVDGTQRARCLSYCPGATLTYVDCKPRELDKLVCAHDAELESHKNASATTFVLIGSAVVAFLAYQVATFSFYE